MSEIGHAFSQPGVSCLDGRLGGSTKAGVGGGAASWDPWHLGQGCPGGEDDSDSPRGLFLVETGSSGHMGSPQGDKRVKTA